MRILILAAALALTACSSPPPAAPPAPPATPTSDAVAAPAPLGALRIVAADAGKTIAAPVGSKVSVELVGVPTAGYLWSVVEKPAFLAEAGTMGGPTTEAQKQPGFAGGNHWEVFVFTVQSAGKGALKLEQRRPSEKTEPPSQTFEVVIEGK
jgi:predicted secreted protein